MQRKDFERDRNLLSALTLSTFQRAAREEGENVAPSEPVVQSFRKHMFAASGRIQGSYSGRYQLRSQIWSTAHILQPPSLWITINPRPVASKKTAPLYYPCGASTDTADEQLGRSIYEHFEVVVRLKDQVRITDPEWLDLLRNVRHGSCRAHHI